MNFKNAVNLFLFIKTCVMLPLHLFSFPGGKLKYFISAYRKIFSNFKPYIKHVKREHGDSVKSC